MSASQQSLAIIVPEMLPVPPVQGGAVEHWVHEVSKRLDKTKFCVSIFSRPANARSVEGVKYVGIPWTSLEKFCHRLKERSNRKNPLRYLAKIQNVTSYGLRVAREARGFDSIVIHNEPNLVLFLRKKPAQKIILHMHNEHLSMWLFRPFYRCALKKVDQVICVSEYIRLAAIEHFPEYADKFSTIFNATDTQVFKPYGDEGIKALHGLVDIEKNKTYLLYAGRLTDPKGVHVLIEAFKRVHQHKPCTRLIIAGSSFFGGAARTKYEQYLEVLAKPVSSAILFTGYLPHEKLKYLYSSVDIVLIPSIWQDPCPLVVLEAMAAARCVIASAVGGIPEVLLHQINGILVPPNDVEAIAKAITHVIKNPKLRLDMGNTAREKTLLRYDWSRLVQEIESSFLPPINHSQLTKMHVDIKKIEVTH